MDSRGTEQRSSHGDASMGLNHPGPQIVPKVECGKCGEGHHPDRCNGEYLGQCSECSAFLPRPTEEQQKKFSDFILWKFRHSEGQ